MFNWPVLIHSIEREKTSLFIKGAIRLQTAAAALFDTPDNESK